jgi:hypothetical protein
VNGQRSRLTGGKLGTLDFGRMTTGQRLGFSLEIAGNMGYDVMLESENGGKFQGSGQSNNDAVPYRLYLGGLGFDAAQPVRLPFQPATSMGRTVNIHQIDVEIGDVSRALAGSYSDNLIVTVTTR